MTYNILNESLITNATVTGTQRTLNALEIESLLKQDSFITLTSGETLALEFNLITQRAVSQFEYVLSNPATSGISIKYGRSLDNLFESNFSITTSSIQVLPTESGFTSPRYFVLEHTATENLQLSGLNLTNQEDNLIFSPNPGTILGTQFSSESEPFEVTITNSGNIISDVLVTVDAQNLSIEDLARISIGTTSTGTFYSFNEALSVPEVYPWEWGRFENLQVSSENEIIVGNLDNPLGQLTAGTVRELDNTSAITSSKLRDSNMQEFANIIEVKDAFNKTAIAYQLRDHRFVITDIYSDVKTVSVSPPYSSTTDYNKLTYDGIENIYYLRQPDSQEIYCYNVGTNNYSLLTTVTGFYSTQSHSIVFDNDYLYFLGVSSGTGVINTGKDCWRVNIDTLVEEQLATIPSYLISNQNAVVLSGFIYQPVLDTPTTNAADKIYRYSIGLNTWQLLTPPVDFLSIQPDFKNNLVLVGFKSATVPDDIFQGFYSFDPSTTAWSSGVVLDTDRAYTRNLTTLLSGSKVFYGLERENTTGADDFLNPILELFEDPDLPFFGTVSGTWTSPIFRINSDENTIYRPVFELEDTEGFTFTVDSGLQASTYSFRGSDSSPSAENIFELYLETLDTENEFFTDVIGSTIVSSGGELTFSHDDTLAISGINAGYVYFDLPFATTGKMQYKFSWSPPSDKESSTTTKSAFILAPYIDELTQGRTIQRSSSNLFRTNTSSIVYLRFGSNTDTGGVLSSVSFWNGSTTVSTPVSLVTGTFYDFELLIDWESGAWSLYIDGNFKTSGIIPQFVLTSLRNYHTYEQYSSTTLASEEKYSYLTVSRLNNVPTEASTVIPIHRQDETFGANSSLNFTTVSTNNPLVPTNEYTQYKLGLTGEVGKTSPRIKSMRFSPVLRFSDVSPGDSVKVYVKYNFPASNGLEDNTILLKSWIRIDNDD